MEIKPKFKAGDKVFYITITNNKVLNKSFCELSIDIVEAVTIYKDRITYWVASCDGEVNENCIIGYDKDKIFDYLEKNLNVNEVEE